MCSGRTLVSVTLPRVMAAAIIRVAASMRSGMTVCSTPKSRSTPSMRRNGVASPEIRAPIALSRLPRSTTSGSQATGFDGRCSFGQGGGHHHVAGSRHGAAEGPAQMQMASAQPGGLGDDVAPFDADLGPERPQPLEMQVDRPIADVAAAGKRDAGFAPLGQQRPQHAETGPHPADKLVIGDVRSSIDDAQRQLVAAAARDAGPQRFEQGRQRVDVDQAGHAVKDRFAVGGQSRRHQGQRRVLRPADRDGSAKGFPALNDEHVHPWTLSMSS